MACHYEPQYWLGGSREHKVNNRWISAETGMYDTHAFPTIQSTLFAITKCESKFLGGAKTYEPIDVVTHLYQTTNGFSPLQMEAIMLACMRHRVIVDGTRLGILIDDGPGVGKTRTLLGIVLETHCRATKEEEERVEPRTCISRKHLWLTLNETLVKDAKRAIASLSDGRLPLIDKGILENTSVGVLVEGYNAFIRKPTYNKVTEWLNHGLKDSKEEFDGVIVLDEYHKFKSEKAKVRMKIEEILRTYPMARIVFSSATGLSDLDDFRILGRLGLWGDDKIHAMYRTYDELRDRFSRLPDAFQSILARELKRRGAMISRQLSIAGCEFGDESANPFMDVEAVDPQNPPLTQQAQESINRYNQMTVVLRKVYERTLNKSDTERGYWAMALEVARWVLTGMKLELIRNIIAQYGYEEYAYIVGIFGVGDIEDEKEAKDGDDDDDIEEEEEGGGGKTKKVKPANEYLKQHPYYRKSPAASRIVRFIFSDNTSPKDAIAKITEMEKDLRIFADANPNSLDQLIEIFGGRDKVAECTSRKKYWDYDKHGEFKAYPIKGKMEDRIKAFMKGEKVAAIISAAGSTGVSLHASKENPKEGQKRRIHITLEYQWGAAEMMQQLGRSHRAHEVSRPIYRNCVINYIPADKRFMGVLSERVKTMNRLSSGGEETSTSAYALSEIEIYDQYLLALTMKEIQKQRQTWYEHGIETWGHIFGIESTSLITSNDTKGALEKDFKIKPRSVWQASGHRSIIDEIPVYLEALKYPLEILKDVSNPKVFFNRLLVLPIPIQWAVLKLVDTIYDDMKSKSNMANSKICRVIMLDPETKVHVNEIQRNAETKLVKSSWTWKRTITFNNALKKAAEIEYQTRMDYINGYDNEVHNLSRHWHHDPQVNPFVLYYATDIDTYIMSPLLGLVKDVPTDAEFRDYIESLPFVKVTPVYKTGWDMEATRSTVLPPPPPTVMNAAGDSGVQYRLRDYYPYGDLGVVIFNQQANQNVVSILGRGNVNEGVDLDKNVSNFQSAQSHLRGETNLILETPLEEGQDRTIQMLIQQFLKDKRIEYELILIKYGDTGRIQEGLRMISPERIKKKRGRPSKKQQEVIVCYPPRINPSKILMPTTIETKPKDPPIKPKEVPVKPKDPPKQKPTVTTTTTTTVKDPPPKKQPLKQNPDDTPSKRSKSTGDLETFRKRVDDDLIFDLILEIVHATNSTSVAERDAFKDELINAVNEYEDMKESVIRETFKGKSDDDARFKQLYADRLLWKLLDKYTEDARSPIKLLLDKAYDRIVLGLKTDPKPTVAAAPKPAPKPTVAAVSAPKPSMAATKQQPPPTSTKRKSNRWQSSDEESEIEYVAPKPTVSATKQPSKKKSNRWYSSDEEEDDDDDIKSVQRSWPAAATTTTTMSQTPSKRNAQGHEDETPKKPKSNKSIEPPIDLVGSSQSEIESAPSNESPSAIADRLFDTSSSSDEEEIVL